MLLDFTCTSKMLAYDAGQRPGELVFRMGGGSIDLKSGTYRNRREEASGWTLVEILTFSLLELEVRLVDLRQYRVMLMRMVPEWVVVVWEDVAGRVGSQFEEILRLPIPGYGQSRTIWQHLLED